jgi:hypothetical protein
VGRRTQVHFWPVAIEVDEHCPASFLKLVTNVCNAAKKLTEKNPQAPKKHWRKCMACELHQTNAKLTLQRNLPCSALLLLVVLCFAFLLVLLINSKTTGFKPTCLLEFQTAVRVVTVSDIPETPGPPAFAQGTPIHLHR